MAAFDLPRSTYTTYRKRRSQTNPERDRLRARVVDIHKASRGGAGARTIAGTLNQEGEVIGRHKVTRLMAEAQITSKQPGPKRFKPAVKPSDIASNDLNREFTVERPNDTWCGDVTYIWSGNQWLYLALVIDLFARRIVGWAVSDSPDSALTGKALTTAFYSRGKPEGVRYHSDQGCHYTSQEFRGILTRNHIKQSMSRRGNCWDNAPMERVFRSLKTEWMPKNGYDSVDEAEADLFAFIQYYNFMRAHSYNNYATPAAAEEELKYQKIILLTGTKILDHHKAILITPESLFSRAI